MHDGVILMAVAYGISGEIPRIGHMVQGWSVPTSIYVVNLINGICLRLLDLLPLYTSSSSLFTVV